MSLTRHDLKGWKRRTALKVIEMKVENTDRDQLIATLNFLCIRESYSGSVHFINYMILTLYFLITSLDQTARPQTSREKKKEDDDMIMTWQSWYAVWWFQHRGENLCLRSMRWRMAGLRSHDVTWWTPLVLHAHGKYLYMYYYFGGVV